MKDEPNWARVILPLPHVHVPRVVRPLKLHSFVYVERKCRIHDDDFRNLITYKLDKVNGGFTFVKRKFDLFINPSFS